MEKEFVVELYVWLLFIIVFLGDRRLRTLRSDRLRIIPVLERTLLTAQESYISLLRLDKSLDPARLRHFLTEAKSDFQSIPEIWKLQKLGTDPAFQRRGVASLLLDWGKLLAEREGVPIGLESSLQARPLYRKSGFRWAGGIRIEGVTVENAPVLLWEPRGKEGWWSVKGDGYHGSEKV